MKRGVSKKTLFLGVFSSLLFAVPASAATVGFAETYALPLTSSLSDNLYVAAGTAIISGTVAGDVVVASGNATVAGAVAGDVLAAGATVDVLGEVSDDVRAAGGQVTFAKSIGGDVVAAGGSVSLLPTSRVAKDALLAGGRILLLGDVAGNAYLAGADIFIDGKISGTVFVYSSGRIRLGPHALIGGDFKYRAGQEVEISPLSVIRGKVSFHYLPPFVSASDVRGVFLGIFGIAFIVRLLILILTALLLVFVFRRASGNLAGLAVREFPKMALVGLIVFATVPIASLLLAFTLVGLLVSVLIMSAWVLLFLVAQVYAGVAFAYVCRRYLLHKDVPSLVSWKEAVLGILLLNVLCLIPYVGVLVYLAFFLVALGAVSTLAYRHFLLSR